MAEVRAIFIYLTIIAIILGSVGILMLNRDLTGLAVRNEEDYSEEEIAKHNSEKDCWISSDDKVYDITLFLQVYPDKTLKEKCGGDVDLYFFYPETRKILQEYEIGNLK